MEQKNIHRIVSALLIILCLAACSAPSLPSPTQTQLTNTQIPPATSMEVATEAPATATEPPTAAAAEGLCTNAFYPVRDGATWTYKSTGSPAGDYSFTDTITSARQDGFTLSTQIAGLTVAQEWTCSPEGLVALQLGGAPAAMLTAQNIRLSLETKNLNGVTFPSQVKAGDQWQQTADVDGNVSMGNEGGKATGTAQLNFNALGNESVTVPAGTFDAMKVKVDTTLDVKVTYGVLSIPIKFTVRYTYWFVPDVGWVKATGNGSLMGTSFSETTELQSYNVP
jgi:hypothetical protein